MHDEPAPQSLDGIRRPYILGTGIYTAKNCVAGPQPTRVVKPLKKRRPPPIARVLHKSKKFGNGCRAQIFFLKPDNRARSVAASAKNAVYIRIKLLDLLRALAALFCRLLIAIDVQPGLNSPIGIPEGPKVNHQVFNNVHIRQGFHEHLIANKRGKLRATGKHGGTVNQHAAGSTDSTAAGIAECQAVVNGLLNIKKRLKNRATPRIALDKGCVVRGLIRLRVKSKYLERILIQISIYALLVHNL